LECFSAEQRIFPTADHAQYADEFSFRNGVNSLNELTGNTDGGTLMVMGTTTSAATNVIVNGTNSADIYGDANMWLKNERQPISFL